MDNRGTGGSALIDCRRLQSYTGVSSGRAFPRVVAGCARQIERRYGSAPTCSRPPTRRATWPRVIRALRLGRVDLYGDSYGTFFVQSFISRYQGLLHSVVLDSSYPVRDLDPWYVSSGHGRAQRARRGLRARPGLLGGRARAARRSASARCSRGCARAAIAGRVRDADGRRVRVRFDVRALVDLVQDAGSEPLVYRELDPAVRAALAGDDGAAAAARRRVDRAALHGGGGDPADYSGRPLLGRRLRGLPAAVLDAARRPPSGARQLAASLPAPPAGAFDPFTRARVGHAWTTTRSRTRAASTGRARARWSPPVPADAAVRCRPRSRC